MTAQSSNADVLLVAASAPDFIGFCGHLGERIEGSLRGLSIRSKLIGFGGIHAASATSRGILATQPRAVIFVGTAGLYPGPVSAEPCEVVVATEVVTIDVGVLHGHAEWPFGVHRNLKAHPAIVGGFLSVRPHLKTMRVGSPAAFTRNDGLARLIASQGNVELENTEAYGVALAAASSSCPFACVLGISHLVGSTAHIDQPRFHRGAVERVAELVIAWLELAAPGLPPRRDEP
ncbi:MAG: hypothetical protein NZM37_02640 [Sandaracinaceae bacterium]|nr:hypothetical protein [Sandaracinaceae bacterium]